MARALYLADNLSATGEAEWRKEFDAVNYLLTAMA